MRITLNIGAGLSFYRVPSGSCKGSAGEERIEEEADREKSMFRGPFIPRIELMCLIGLLSLLGGRSSLAQKAPEGIWEGYDGEWQHVSAQLIALAEATPEEKFAWRPALVTGPKMPADLKEEMEKTVTSKADVISWLKRSLEAVRQAHLAETPKDLGRKVHIADRDSTVDWIYLRIIIHANEHMGQLVAYARMTGVVPPWSRQ